MGHDKHTLKKNNNNNNVIYLALSKCFLTMVLENLAPLKTSQPGGPRRGGGLAKSSQWLAIFRMEDLQVKSCQLFISH